MSPVDRAGCVPPHSLYTHSSFTAPAALRKMCVALQDFYSVC
eukprot:gene1574-4722_t